MDNKKPKKRNGLLRVFYAFTYSYNGLSHAIKNETAFRQEFYIIAIMIFILFFLPVTPYIKIILFFSNTSILITELLNSALEAIVDLASPEYQLLAKQAKDMGSAAVFISLVTSLILWIYTFFIIFFL